jgi:hypothetical protein
VLDSLKNLLTNPNFVAVDEVELREEEIHRLRAGWEKMEARLREAFSLMDSWRKRMTNGDTIHLDELRMGMHLGAGFDRDDVSMIEGDEEEIDEDASSVFDEDMKSSTFEADVPEKTISDIFKLKLQPHAPALRETNGNKSPTRSPRKVAFSASIPNTPSQLESETADASGIELVDVETPSCPPSAAKAPQSTERASRLTSQDERTPRHVRCDNIADRIVKMASNATFSSSPSLLFDSPTAQYSNNTYQTRKRHSSPHAHPDEPLPKLTVHDKLAQAEADAAAVAEGLKAASPQKMSNDIAAVEEKSKRRATRSPMKTKIHGRPKRRKSTLTPEELENLLGC